MMIDPPRGKQAIAKGYDYFPFQKAGINRMVMMNSVLLADDMGLGKTCQAIGACNLWRPSSVLVICPASLKGNWLKEFLFWSTLQLSVGVAAGNHYPNTDVVIINYDIICRHEQRIKARNWDVLIFDEAHYCKDKKAERTKCVTGYRWTRKPIQAKRKVAITGTPFVNRPKELYSIVNYLQPGLWGSFHNFALRYCNAHRQSWGGHWDYDGASNLPELRTRLVNNVMIRRLKGEVQHELKAKTRQIIEIDPDTGRRKTRKEETGVLRQLSHLTGAEFQPGDELDDDAFRQLVRSMSGARGGFDSIATLRRETGEEKIPFVIKHLHDVLASTDKVVCFAWHKSVIRAIYDEFKNFAVKIDGDTPTGIRSGAGSIEERFQTDPTCRLFIGQISAAGTGLNLYAASTVVFAELDWVPGNMTQAEDRCHRIGQKDAVLVQHIVMAGSIDASIAKTVVRKQEIFEEAQNHPDQMALSKMLQ